MRAAVEQQAREQAKATGGTDQDQGQRLTTTASGANGETADTASRGVSEGSVVQRTNRETIALWSGLLGTDTTGGVSAADDVHGEETWERSRAEEVKEPTFGVGLTRAACI